MSLAIAAAMVLYIIRSDLLDQIDLSQPRWEYVALLILTRIVVFGMLGYIIALFVRRRGIKLDVMEWLAISISSLFINTITPIGGAALVRGGYLKLKHRFPLTQFMAFIGANIVVNYFSAGVLGLLTLLALSVRRGISWEGMLLMLGVISTAGIFTVIPFEALNLNWIPGRLNQWLKRALDGWRIFRTDPVLLASLVGMALAVQSTEALSYTLGLMALGEQPRYLDMLFTSAMATIVRVTPIRDIFGINELAGGVATSMIGEGSAVGITAALMLRLSNLVVLFVLGPLATYLLSKRLGMPLLSALKREVND